MMNAAAAAAALARQLLFAFRPSSSPLLFSHNNDKLCKSNQLSKRMSAVVNTALILSDRPTLPEENGD